MLYLQLQLHASCSPQETAAAGTWLGSARSAAPAGARRQRGRSFPGAGSGDGAGRSGCRRVLFAPGCQFEREGVGGCRWWGRLGAGHAVLSQQQGGGAAASVPQGRGSSRSCTERVLTGGLLGLRTGEFQESTR